jgi:hypothetical protein
MATPRRHLLREQVALKSTLQLGSFYWEAIRSLREGEDDVRFQVAGHLLRELQEELPKYQNVPEIRGRGVGEFWGWVSVAWEGIVRGRPEKVGDELWTTTPIDRPLARFLATLHDKIRHYATVLIRKRTRYDEMLGRLDPNLATAPDAVRKGVVDDWMRLNEVFNTATHSVDPEQFEDAVELFERLLEDRLAPQTLEKEDAITAFVQEVERHA